MNTIILLITMSKMDIALCPYGGVPVDVECPKCGAHLRVSLHYEICEIDSGWKQNALPL